MASVSLREIQDEDLPIFFEQMTDPAACHMAAFTCKDPGDHAAFLGWFTRVRKDPQIVASTVIFNGAVAGQVLSHRKDGRQEICYWFGREYWSRGVATAALTEYLLRVSGRPIYARAARDNVGSIRVLEKCGFILEDVGRGFANARGEEIDEVVMVLGA
jgi:RimJ/RimL family protein N-acetyltransferase